jgi:hypothetical protein
LKELLQLQVLNFVPCVSKRGEMLQLCGSLVVPGGLLLVVMPRACVDNSRYMTQERFVAIMEAQGFRLLRDKLSTRLAFYVLQQDSSRRKHIGFKKELLRDGGGLNNFCVVLEGAEVEDEEEGEEKGQERDEEKQGDEDEKIGEDALSDEGDNGRKGSGGHGFVSTATIRAAGHPKVKAQRQPLNATTEDKKSKFGKGRSNSTSNSSTKGKQIRRKGHL